MAGRGLLREFGSPDGTVSLLLVGPGLFCLKLSEALEDVQEFLRSADTTGGVKCKLKVHKCENVYDVLRHLATVKPYVDVVFILLDTKRRNCIEDARNNIRMLDPSFLYNRLCLVNGCNVGLNRSAVSLYEITALQLRYGLPLLKGDISDKLSCLKLAYQIVCFATTTVGVTTGMPYVDMVPIIDNTPVARELDFSGES